MPRLLLLLLSVPTVYSFTIIKGTFPPKTIVLDGPYCHSCEMIINDVRSDYHNNFKHVTPEELLRTLDQECDKNYGGDVNEECHEIATTNVNLILYNLQQGHTAYYICLTINPSLC